MRQDPHSRPPLSHRSRRASRPAVIAVALAVASTGSILPAGASDTPDGDRVQVVVSFDADGPGRQALGTAAEHGWKLAIEQAQADLTVHLDVRSAEIERSYELSTHVVVEIDSAEVDGLAEIPGVTSVVPNITMQPMLDDSLPVIGAPAMVNDTTLTGRGHAVAVLDTGVDSAHPFFARDDGGHRIVAEACFARDKDCPNGTVGAGSGAPLLVSGEPNSHGTHVAGIAAGARDGTDPAQGVAPQADILAAQVFNTEDGVSADFADLLAAMDWVYAQRNNHDIAAVNLSLGTTAVTAYTCDGAFTDFTDVIDDLRSAGIVTIVAAGNAGERDAMSWPACISSAISVGATDNSDTFASFTNVSSHTDLMAPGSMTSSIPGGDYASLPGTSMAAPMVAGAAAVLREAVADATSSQLSVALRTSTAALDDGRTGGIVTGVPRLDLMDALGSLGETTVTAPSPPSLSVMNGDLSASLSWAAVTAPQGGTITYRIHRSTTSSCSASNALLYNGSKRGFTDSGLKHGTTYRYCGYSVEGASNVSGRSTIVQVTAKDLSSPTAPTLTIESSDLAVKASWPAVSDPTSPVTYRLHRSTTSSCSPSSPVVYKGTSRSVVNSGLTPGAIYRYCVTATDGAGNRSPLSNITWTTAGYTSASRPSGAIPVMGDWNGNGIDTPGWFHRGDWHLRNSHSRGPADIVLRYGRDGDMPVAGDWNGDGVDTIGVVRVDPDDRLRFILRYEYRSGADIVMHYGRKGDTPVTGDWNGNGIDTLGVVRTDPDERLRFILRYEYRSGADIVLHYGRRGDTPVVGDFNGDGTDTLGVQRDRTFILRYIYRSGADIVLDYGRTTDTPIIGDFNGDGRDTLGVRRAEEWILRYVYRSGADILYYW